MFEEAQLTSEERDLVRRPRLAVIDSFTASYSFCLKIGCGNWGIQFAHLRCYARTVA